MPRVVGGALWTDAQRCEYHRREAAEADQQPMLCADPCERDHDAGLLRQIAHERIRSDAAKRAEQTDDCTSGALVVALALAVVGLALLGAAC